eukprot:223041-Pyramimonas_sp.AAC.1
MGHGSSASDRRWIRVPGQRGARPHGASPSWARAVRAARQARCAGPWARYHLPFQRRMQRGNCAGHPLPG